MSLRELKIWLSPPHMGESEIAYMLKAFELNLLSSSGANLDNFEKDLSDYTGSKNVVALSSGTSAIHLALILLDVKAGDKVICQSFTFSATANPIIYQGAEPVFIDSEPDTWNMDPKALEEAIQKLHANGEKPKVIIPVHLYGMPAKMDEIMAISKKYNIPVIEDAAEALGSMYKNKACGTFGDLGILSFNGNKIITTSGGGALISDNEEWIKKARFLATQARDNAPHYQHSHIGYNYRMNNIVAGIGRGQMEVLDQRVKQRRANYEFYKKAFSQIEGVTLLEEQEGVLSNRWLSCILVNPAETKGITREDIRLALGADNIESRPLWKPMHLQPVFEKYNFFGNGTSEKLFNNGLCLPSGSNLTKEDLERIVRIITDILNSKTNTK